MASQRSLPYITRLGREKDTAIRELEAVKAGIRELIGYLQSSKFHTDPTVQSQDVVNRLLAIEVAGADAAANGPQADEPQQV